MSQSADLLNYLHELVSVNVIGDKQYNSRYKGFAGELEFEKWYRENRPGTRVYLGGYFVPATLNGATLNDPVYFTAGSDHPDDYTGIYKSISAIGCKGMYFIRWDKGIPFENWLKEEVMHNKVFLPVPSITVFKFDVAEGRFAEVGLPSFLSEFTPVPVSRISRVDENTREIFLRKLNHFDFDDLLNIYVQRLFFDGYLGFGVSRGIPGDIDQIIMDKKQAGKYIFIEVKEKDLSKTPPQGFGMDVRRIEDLQTISRKTGNEYLYIVRRVNNQRDRRFVEWLCIDIGNFSKHLSENVIPGGTGMRSEKSDNPTRICPYVCFRKFG